jgi:hypothetical protein
MVTSDYFFASMQNRSDYKNYLRILNKTTLNSVSNWIITLSNHINCAFSKDESKMLFWNNKSAIHYFNKNSGYSLTYKGLFSGVNF